MAVDEATVTRIAALARIRLSEAETVPLAEELSRILDWIAQLDELDTEGVPPLANVAEIALPMREDKVSDGNCPDAILGNAPQSARGFFVVPKVVE